MSSLVTLASPGVAADSNGLFHGLGDHAENSFSVDGQPITDQQSKVFSNQIPLDRCAVDGSDRRRAAGRIRRQDQPGDQGHHALRPGRHHAARQRHRFLRHASAPPTRGFDLAYGGEKWGNFISVSGLNTGRFLDRPEFTVMHDKGNEENRLRPRGLSSLDTQTRFTSISRYTRSWFQTPNSYDAQLRLALVGVVVDNGGLDPDGNPVGPTDQRSKIGTFNIAPTWTHLINSTTVFTLGGFRAARSVQLLSQRQSFRRPRPLRSAAGNRRPEPHAHQRRRSAPISPT